jgi:stage V sporulation protein G
MWPAPGGCRDEGGVSMEITQVRVFPVQEEKLKAFVSVIFDDCFVVSDIKIIQGNSGLFISMPSKKRKNGTFRDIAHPLNNETRRKFEEQIIDEYKEVIAQAGDGSSAPIRELDSEEDIDHQDLLEPPFDRPGN